MMNSHCLRCNAAHGRHGRCDRCGGPIPVRLAPDRLTEVFDLADRGLDVGGVFRWPCGTGARSWRIVAILDPEVDELTQRVRAVGA